MNGNGSISGDKLCLTVGTKRGLFIFTSKDRQSWELRQHALPGAVIYNAILDPRDGRRMYAADNNVFFGSFVRFSDDLGETWSEPETGIEFDQESGTKLNAIWIIQPGRESDPDTVYAGVDPGALWVSHDRGQNWELVGGLVDHPTRDRWQPGAGGMCLHSVVLDPHNADRMWIGISAVGCLRTDDGGKTWVFANKNTRAGFLPDPYPEFGQCIHRLVPHPSKPDTLYQQNHCGVYMTENAGNDWTDIQNNLPSEFGFPMALDPHHPETLFTIVEDPMGRFNVGRAFTVYRTENAGENWEPLTNGLPQGPQVKLGVLRHGMTNDQMDPCGVYVGTNTGQLFGSADRGDSWQLIADFLPPIYSVNVTALA